MSPVYLCGRALASARGLTLEQAAASLRAPAVAGGSYWLAELGALPYQRIPDPPAPWEMRARALVTQVAGAAGAAQARDGALFIATSCLDGDAAEQSLRDMDFHALAARIGAWLDWRGPVFLISTACTSSLQALLSAQEWLGAGRCSEALVLGLELDNRLTVPGFAALQLLSPSRSQPFGVARDGLVLGEAVAALRLSTRAVSPWQLRGGAHVVDGTQATSASAAAVALMCQRALAASARQAADVDLIKVQAAGSPTNDASEAEGLRSAFCASPGLPALLSLKPLIGHCMGASGAAEIALLLECLEQGVWPALPACDVPDPALAVQLARQAPARLRCILAAILGFGGSHAAVLLERSAP